MSKHKSEHTKDPQQAASMESGTDEASVETEIGVAGIEEAAPLAGLQEQLRQAEQKAAENHDAWMRAKAEVENTRRRAQEDVVKAHRFAVEKFAIDLLAVKDTLEMALADSNPDSLRSGLELTLKNLVSAFERSSIVEVNPVGKTFDPNCHQAMSVVPASVGTPDNTVAQVFQKGYRLAERTLRPAMVVVAKEQKD
ncbi:MAG: nucleotide exchange factor GrpE [Betaproteobacteria bacterium]|nr:nucleotide exchange factor GrpE [Betaproteobacteria bacterium]